MKLTRDEHEMLDGKRGYAPQKAMEILVGVGECYDAERLIPISSAHLVYNASSMGKGGAYFLQDLADNGGKFVVHTDTNPSGVVRWLWREFGITEEYAKEQQAIADAIVAMGGFLADTCAPFLAGNIPRLGEHIAWNESSAISIANSVFGARTNREGGPSAVAAAIAGRTPDYGMHLDANRRGDLKIAVTAKLNGLHDYGTLGYFVGKLAEDRVPVLTGIPHPVSGDALKQLAAGAATSGSVALFHVVGITPEAPTEAKAFGRRKVRASQTFEFGENELRETEQSLCKSARTEVDIVVVGCPHASIDELAEIARQLDGKKVKPGVEFWVSTLRMVKQYGEAMGYTKAIEASGARIVCDTCPASIAGAYARQGRPMTALTNSAKMTGYIGLYAQNVLPLYGSLEKCVEAAMTGHWRRP